MFYSIYASTITMLSIIQFSKVCRGKGPSDQCTARMLGPLRKKERSILLESYGGIRDLGVELNNRLAVC